MDDSLLEAIIIAQWVKESDVDKISEENLQKCIQERSTVCIENYELYVIEKGLNALHLDIKVKTLENRVW